MHYLHGLDQPVIHRDIKSGNVLVDDVTGDAKLCDFGLASTKVVTAGTPAYMAPELLQGKPYNKASAQPSADVACNCSNRGDHCHRHSRSARSARTHADATRAHADAIAGQRGQQDQS